MKYLNLLAMSLLSILFGCNSKPTPAAAKAWPRFPATDHPETKVVAVPLDDGFTAKSFFIPEDRQSVLVLGIRVNKKTLDGEPLPGEQGETDYRVYSFDLNGKKKKHKDIFHTNNSWGASFGVLENQLLLQIADYFLVLDPETLNPGEKIPVYDEQHFPSKQKVELMTPDEQRDAYQKLFDALPEKHASCKWLDWYPGGQYYVFVQGAAGHRAAWSPLTYEDELLADLKRRFEPIVVQRNPEAIIPEKGGNFQMSDAGGQVREAGYLSAGTELDYPNYKSRTIVQYEVKMGNKTLHFSTSDQERHNLRLGFADNMLLTTADGVAWVSYEGVLYRME